MMSRLLGVLLLLGAAESQRTDDCQQAAFSCAGGQTIEGRFRCDGFTDCRRLSGGGGGRNRATATRNSVNVDSDEIGCGGLLDQIVGGHINGLELQRNNAQEVTGFTQGVARDEDGNAIPNPIGNGNVNGIFATVQATGEGEAKAALWQVAAAGAASYTWSFDRCRAQGLENCQSNTVAACNEYKEIPYVEGAFRVTVGDDINGNTQGLFNFQPAAVSPDGVVLPEDYASRYGKQVPNICAGPDLLACLRGEAEDREVQDCVCGGYNVDTELNADFRYQPPAFFTGVITFSYRVTSYSFDPSLPNLPNCQNGEAAVDCSDWDDRQDKLCGGNNDRGSTGCSEQSADTGLISVTVLVTESACVGWAESNEYDGEDYCKNGICAAPAGCVCDPEYTGERCDTKRAISAALSSTANTVVVVFSAMTLALLF